MMNTMQKRFYNGFTIIELMVSLTIGLAVTWAVTSLFTSTYQTFKTQDTSSRNQETGRYALSVLSQHIRQAGFFELTSMGGATSFSTFVDLNAPNLLSVPAIEGCDGTISYGTTGWSCLPSAGEPSSILVAYQVQPTAVSVTRNVNNLVSPGAGGASAGTDCLGQDPTNGGTALLQGIVAANYFYLDRQNQKLMCQGNGGRQPKAIADGIEDMRITYGVNSSPLNPVSTVQYKSAQAVGANWPSVVAVRLCLQVKAMQVTGSGSNKGGGAANYASSGVNYANMSTGQDCQARNWNQQGLYTDGVLRKVYWATITLRNQAPHIPL